MRPNRQLSRDPTTPTHACADGASQHVAQRVCVCACVQVTPGIRVVPRGGVDSYRSLGAAQPRCSPTNWCSHFVALVPKHAMHDSLHPRCRHLPGSASLCRHWPFTQVMFTVLSSPAPSNADRRICMRDAQGRGLRLFYAFANNPATVANQPSRVGRLAAAAPAQQQHRCSNTEHQLSQPLATPPAASSADSEVLSPPLPHSRIWQPFRDR